MLRPSVALLLSVWFAAPLAAQTSQEPPPASRRWVDIQHLQLSSRFRWVASTTGTITSSTHQWQPQIRARLLIDPNAHYTINVGAFSGSQFVSGWNNTGGGLGTFTGDFNVKQLFVVAEPVRGVEFQAGGLYVLRGENTEITSYDNDAYIIGERVTVRRPRGAMSQVAATVGYIGDYRTPNVIERFKRAGEWNYGQLLIGLRAGSLASVSADYTYEDGRDILREAVAFRLPAVVKALTAMRLEAYQRLSGEAGQGFNVGADLRLGKAFTVTTGVAHIDRHYLIPGYTSPNSDRFERGTRFYSQGTYAVTRDISVGWFQGDAFSTDYVVPNEHRWEVLVTINPTAKLRAKGMRGP